MTTQEFHKVPLFIVIKPVNAAVSPQPLQAKVPLIKSSIEQNSDELATSTENNKSSPKYLSIRSRNNISVKKCRARKKLELQELKDKIIKLENDNQLLKEENVMYILENNLLQKKVKNLDQQLKEI